jgi:hypothetical protein
MGHFVDEPWRDALLCESHDAWVTRDPYEDDYKEEETEDEED